MEKDKFLSFPRGSVPTELKRFGCSLKSAGRFHFSFSAYNFYIIRTPNLRSKFMQSRSITKKHNNNQSFIHLHNFFHIISLCTRTSNLNYTIILFAINVIQRSNTHSPVLDSVLNPVVNIIRTQSYNRLFDKDFQMFQPLINIKKVASKRNFIRSLPKFLPN